MSEMIERVARSMFHAENEPHKAETKYGELWDWLDVMPAVRERHMTNARAAIKAMREPTEEMIEKGSDARRPGNSRWGNSHGTWKAMIDAALK